MATSEDQGDLVRRHLVEMLRHYALEECEEGICEEIPRWSRKDRNQELPALREAWETMTPEQQEAVKGFMRLAAFDTLHTVIGVIGGTGTYDPPLDWWGCFRLEYRSEDGGSSVTVTEDGHPGMMEILMEESPFAW